MSQETVNWVPYSRNVETVKTTENKESGEVTVTRVTVVYVNANANNESGDEDLNEDRPG